MPDRTILESQDQIATVEEHVAVPIAFGPSRHLGRLRIDNIFGCGEVIDQVTAVEHAIEVRTTDQSLNEIPDPDHAVTPLARDR